MTRSVAFSRQVKEIRQGDMVVFNPATRILEIRRPAGPSGKSEVLFSTECPIINNRKFFLDFVRLMGKVAQPKLSNTVQCPHEGSSWVVEYI